MGTLESEILSKSVCLALYTGGLDMLIVGHAGYLDCIHSYARFPSIHCPHRVAEAGADPGETGVDPGYVK